MAKQDGVKLNVLLGQILSEEEYPNILYYMTSLYGWDSDSIITEDNIEHMKTDIEQARGVWKREMGENSDDEDTSDDDDWEDDEDDEDEISFYCSNERGEGMVTFEKEGSYWHEHWSDWEGYDEDDDGAPDAMRYESYLSKDDLKNWLYHDGFTNITEVE